MSHLVQIIQLILTVSSSCAIHPEFCLAENKIVGKHATDFYVAGMFSVHSYVDKYKTKGLLRMEVAKFALRQANQEVLGSSNAYLGYVFYDICNDYSTTVSHMVEILLDKSNERHQQINLTPVSIDEAKTCHCPTFMEGDRLLGVLGPSSSSVSTGISTIASYNMIPVVSFASTSVALSNKNLYPSFKRTVPPDNFQAILITDLLIFYNWTYVSILATDDAYGRLGKQELEKLFKYHAVCIAESMLLKVPISESELDEAITRLRNQPKANVIILWTAETYAITVLQRAFKLGLLYKTWITSESMGTSEKVTKLPPELVTGLLTVVPNYGVYKDFEDYFWNITYHDTEPNSWLRAFFELKGINSTGTGTTLGNFKAEFQLGKNGCVRNAAYAYAHALRTYASATEICTNGNCQIPPITNYDTFGTNFLSNVSFTGLNGEIVEFDENGDITNANYDVYILQQVEKNSNLQFQWLTSANKHGLITPTEDIKIHWHSKSLLPPTSQCSDDCQPGTYAIFHGTIWCCWECIPCPLDTVKSSIGIEPCKQCPEFSISNENRTECQSLEKIFIQAEHGYGIAQLCLTIGGFTCGVFFIITFIVYRATPVVKASNIKLSILQLTLQTLMACTPILFIGEPLKAMCYARMFVIGFLLTFNMAITLVKTQQLVAIFNRNYKLSSTNVKRMKSMERFIVFLWLTIYTSVTAIAFFVKPTRVEYTFKYDINTVELFCKDDAHFVVRVVITFLVTINSVIQGFRVRKLPQNFNEARYIFYASFSTATLLLLAIPIKESTSKSTARMFTVSCIFWLINFIQFALLYGPKIWVIYFCPEKNTTRFFRKTVMDKIQAKYDRELSRTKSGQTQQSRKSIDTRTPSAVSADLEEPPTDIMDL